jgi:hypothetical protein
MKTTMLRAVTPCGLLETLRLSYSACRLLAGFLVGLLLDLKMESIRFFETSIDFYRTTWHLNPEDRNIQFTYLNNQNFSEVKLAI